MLRGLIEIVAEHGQAPNGLSSSLNLNFLVGPFQMTGLRAFGGSDILKIKKFQLVGTRAGAAPVGPPAALGSVRKMLIQLAAD